MTGRSLAALIGVYALLLASVADAAADCRRVPVVAATCFSKRGPSACPAVSPPPPCRTVRGRLYGSNGTPGIRLIPSGSRRILGVVGGEGDPESPTLLPPAVAAAMQPPRPGDLTPIFGEFRVCPLALEKRGWMQPVCLAGGRGLAPLKRED
ncbi:MAG TPA: hypothetical protein VF459_00770 [Caulobacteraceae bacterium]